jgi:hypothetical protein
MAQFQAPVDIGNRAAQHCGASRMGLDGFSEDSKTAGEISACYDQLRQAELRANTWTFACRRAMLRAVDDDTMLLVPALWVDTTTYFVGSIVADENGFPWISRIPDNLGLQPTVIQSAWEPYFGPMSVSLYDADTSYYAGELVYTAAGDGTSRIYVSLQTGNEDVPATATAYDATVTYQKNDVVTYSAVAYMSLVDLNIGQTPNSSPSAWTSTFTGGTGSVKWRQIGGAEFPMGVGLKTLDIIYPLGTGPSTQTSTRNVFVMPAGYLGPASQNPGAGVVSWLGGPSGFVYSDWAFENGFLLTQDSGPIPYRFVADVTDVTKMDPMFCEGLAARIGLEVCEPLTQSSTKLGTIGKLYDEWMSRARNKNAIEQGADEPPDDDFITVRY